MDYKDINQYLKKDFGSSLDGRPNFRLVFSPLEIEKRYGVFRDFDANGGLIREVSETREVKKYWYLEPCYVLERLFFLPIINDEIPGSSQGIYEPFYAFPNVADEPVQPSYGAIKWFLNTLLGQPVQRKTQRQVDLEDDEEFMKEIAELVDFMNQETPYISTMLHDGSAIVVP